MNCWIFSLPAFSFAATRERAGFAPLAIAAGVRVQVSLPEHAMSQYRFCVDELQRLGNDVGVRAGFPMASWRGRSGVSRLSWLSWRPRRGGWQDVRWAYAVGAFPTPLDASRGAHRYAQAKRS